MKLYKIEEKVSKIDSKTDFVSERLHLLDVMLENKSKKIQVY